MTTTSALHRTVRRHVTLGAAVAAIACATLSTQAGAAPPGGPAPFAGGSSAPAGPYAFVAGLRNPGAQRFYCTGSLINAQWVLTAAHCVDDKTTVEVVIGDTNLTDANDPAERRAVDRIAINQRWGGDTGDKHDLAMLHLTAPSTLPTVSFGGSKQLADGFRRCLLQRAMQSVRTMTYLPCKAGVGIALGWGRTSSSGNQTSLTLRQVTPAIFDLAPKAFWRVKAGACPGDSGGPLLVRQPDGSLTQIGVASYAQHGGGWFDWLVGGRCSSRGWDFYADATRTEDQSWMRRLISPPPPPTPRPPTCNNPTKPVCQADDDLH